MLTRRSHAGSLTVVNCRGRVLRAVSIFTAAVFESGMVPRRQWPLAAPFPRRGDRTRSAAHAPVSCAGITRLVQGDCGEAVKSVVCGDPGGEAHFHPLGGTPERDSANRCRKIFQLPLVCGQRQAPLKPRCCYDCEIRFGHALCLVVSQTSRQGAWAIDHAQRECVAQEELFPRDSCSESIRLWCGSF